MNFSVCLPDATINYITNPALRFDTTGWNAQGATITRTLDRARFGPASLKIVTNGAALNEGAFFRVSSLSGVSEPISVSIYVRGDGTYRIRLDNNVVGGTEFASQPTVCNDDYWTRLTVTGFSTGGNDLRLFVETAEGTAKVRTFYADGAQLERKAYITTYCDGDQAGCMWQGTLHGSLSSRSAYTRQGGKWFQLAGPDRENEDLYMTVAGGLGMAPLTNNIQSLALNPGSYFNNKKILNRVMTFTFFAKHVVPDETEQPVSLQKLHQLREILLDAIKPDLTGGDEDLLFLYQDGDQAMYFNARYDGGLEGEWDIRNQFVNSFPLRLLALNPLMREDSQEVSTIDFQETLANKNFAFGRINGVWSSLNYGTSGQTFAVAKDNRERIYIGGTFTTVNSNAAALNPNLAAAVAYWDGTSWTAIAATCNGIIYGLSISPTGDVYACGTFTIIGGVAANRIAKWNGSAWSALGTGLNNDVYCIKIAPNGDVYVGGAFTTAGGVACNLIARWDGTTWRRLGQFGGLTGGSVFALEINAAGTMLYAGGSFTTEFGGGLTLNGITQYNMTAGVFAAMGSGFSTSATVRALYLQANGVLIAGGDFTLSGSVVCNAIAQWNGTAWVAMGAGITGQVIAGTPVSVRTIGAFKNGNILAMGGFALADGHAANRAALWNGSSWTSFDLAVGLAATDLINACVIRASGDVFIGSDLNTTTVFTPGFTNVTNVGSAEAYPVFYLVGPGTLRWLENQSTGKRLYFDLAVLQNEEVFIDIAAGTITSTQRGDLLYTLIPGSDFRAFKLTPGVNLLGCLMTNDVGAKVQVLLPVNHWGVDAMG